MLHIPPGILGGPLFATGPAQTTWTLPPNVFTSPVVPQDKIYYAPDTNQVFIHGDHAWREFPAREDTNMPKLNTYLVKFVGSNRREHIEAHSVEEHNDRIRFMSYDNGATLVKKSFLGDSVASYEVVPDLEKPVEPKHTFKVFRTEGDALTVKADRVLHAPGDSNEGGRYTFLTDLSIGAQRTELVVPVATVDHIERVEDVEDAPADKA